MIHCQLKNLSTRSVNPGGSCRSGKLIYIVSGIAPGENDPGALALQEVRNVAPDDLDGVGLSRITLVKSHGGGIFEVQAEYADSPTDRNSRKKIGDRLWIFDAMGKQEKVLCGKLLRYRAGSTEGLPPDPGSLINWNGKNGEGFHADGTVRIVPSMRESCIAVFRNSDMTGNFRRKIMGLTGRVNDSTFHSWEPGEVLFLGASTSVPFRNDRDVMVIEITVRFAIRPNHTNLIVDGVEMGTAGGWDIPWSIMVPNAAGYSPAPIGVYLSSIYEKGDFSVLKI